MGVTEADDGTLLPNIELRGYFGLDFEGWDKELDADLRLLSILVQARAESRTTTLPSSPTGSPVYIVPSGAASNADDVAAWTIDTPGGAKDWRYFTPQVGWSFWIVDNSELVRWDGAAWVVQGNSGAGNPALGALSDVTISSVSAGEVLTYDSISGDWINTALGTVDLSDVNVATNSTYADGEILKRVSGSFDNVPLISGDAGNAASAGTDGGVFAASAPSVSDSGSVVLSAPTDINFSAGLAVTDDGDGTLKVDATGAGTVAVEDSGTSVLANATAISFGANLSVTDQGDNTIEVDASGSSGGLQEVVEDLSPQLGNDLDCRGFNVENYENKVVTGVSGNLVATSHSGNVLVTSGNITVPDREGFTATIIAGGAHTVTFNSATSAAMAAGDVMTVVVENTTTIHAALTPAADKVSFS